jgi:hypothetical protein
LGGVVSVFQGLGLFQGGGPLGVGLFDLRGNCCHKVSYLTLKLTGRASLGNLFTLTGNYTVKPDFRQVLVSFPHFREKAKNMQVCYNANR